MNKSAVVEDQPPTCQYRMCSKVNKFTQVQGDSLHVNNVNNVGRVEGPSGNMGTSLWTD